MGRVSAELGAKVYLDTNIVIYAIEGFADLAEQIQALLRALVIKEHERVVLKSPVADKGLEAGDVGNVVHVYRDGEAYEVEFVALDGHTAAVVTVESSQVRPVAPGEIPHARELVAA